MTAMGLAAGVGFLAAVPLTYYYWKQHIIISSGPGSYFDLLWKVFATAYVICFCVFWGIFEAFGSLFDWLAKKDFIDLALGLFGFGLIIKWIIFGDETEKKEEPTEAAVEPPKDNVVQFADNNQPTIPQKKNKRLKRKLKKLGSTEDKVDGQVID